MVAPATGPVKVWVACSLRDSGVFITRPKWDKSLSLFSCGGDFQAVVVAAVVTVGSHMECRGLEAVVGSCLEEAVESVGEGLAADMTEYGTPRAIRSLQRLSCN